MRHLNVITKSQQRPASASFFHAVLYFTGTLLVVGGLSKLDPNA